MDEVITKAAEACGGISRLAALIGVSPQRVSNWRERGVPLEHCAAIELAAQGAVRRWHLRPGDWHLIWPELVGADGAPAVPEAAAQGAA